MSRPCNCGVSKGLRSDHEAECVAAYIRSRNGGAPRVPLPECVAGRLYKIMSRNLVLGVFDGKTGFIGIREKFGHEYLFTEFHWDTGPPFGTVSGVEETGVSLPSEIRLAEDLGTIDAATGRMVAFDKPVANGGRGWYFTDTDEPSEEIRPVNVSNGALFDWLMQKERELEPEHRKQVDEVLAKRKRPRIPTDDYDDGAT